MNITEKLEVAINKQINNELISEYLYLGMAAHFEHVNLKGFAHWMRLQANEEHTHAMKLFDFLVEKRGKVALSTIVAPQKEWKSVQEVFDDAYQHEISVTKMIVNLVALAISEKDKSTEVFLGWFITEQIEEESQADEVIQKLKLINNDGVGIYLLNKELGERK